MKDIIKAVNNRLATLYSQSSVFFTEAPKKAAFPFYIFRVLPGTPSIYNGCSSISNVIQTYPVQIGCWNTDLDSVLDAIDEIHRSLESDDLDFLSDKFISFRHTSTEVSQDTEQSTEGQTVWVGILIGEVTLSN